MKAIVVAFVLLAGLDPSGWVVPEITAGRKAVRIVITKNGWRTGPAALVIESPARVERLHRVFRGNQRMAMACGFHWNFLFVYENGATESIDINEECEVFRRDPEATWREISRAFNAARDKPSHFAIALRVAKQNRPKLFAKLGTRFGTVAETEYGAFVLSTQPWGETRVQALRYVCGDLANVEPIRESDTGN